MFNDVFGNAGAIVLNIDADRIRCFCGANRNIAFCVARFCIGVSWLKRFDSVANDIKNGSVKLSSVSIGDDFLTNIVFYVDE